eukprot:gene14113-biopygen17081
MPCGSSKVVFPAFADSALPIDTRDPTAFDFFRNQPPASAHSNDAIDSPELPAATVLHCGGATATRGGRVRRCENKDIGSKTYAGARVRADARRTRSAGAPP